MKNLIVISVFIFICICSSCNKDDKLTQDQEAQNLDQMLTEIQNLASSVSCENASDWTFTSFGSKACGGPVSFIAYSTSIDVNLFLKKIKEYQKAQEAFNSKWGIFSDCSFPQQPIRVICQDGNPIFEY